MYQLKFIFIITVIFIFSPISVAKKHCKPLLEKLHNIQAMQRNGYSSKRGNSLRAREDKARNIWWQCEKGQGKKTKKKNKNKYANKAINDKTKIGKGKNLKADMPFKTSNPIVIKSKYQGDKMWAWLEFYQQPTRCQRPKNLQVFAFCSQDKQTQREGFEKKYDQKNN